MRKILIIMLVAAAAGIAAFVLLLARGDLAESVRFRVVSETSRSLGRDVTVQRVSGDPVRGVVLEGVRVANPPTLPRGSFFEAPRITVRFDLGRLGRDLLAGRSVAQSVIAIELDRPFLVLSRDVKGRWNYEDLFVREDGGVTAPEFRGIVTMREGSLVFSDALAIDTPFSAHFDRITGTLEFSDAPLVRITADAVNTDGDTPALLRVAGRTTIGEGTFDLDLIARGGSSEFWGGYLVRLPWLVWRRGTFDGTMHLLASRWGNKIALDYRGRLTMRRAEALLLPQRTLLTDISGPLVVDNGGVATDGLSMAVGAPDLREKGSPLWMRGTITHVAGVHLDLAARSPSLDLAALQRLFFPRASVRLTGRADGDVRIVGSIDSPRIDGRIEHGFGRLNHQNFADAQGDFSYYGGLLIFDQFALRTGDGQLDGELTLHTRDRTFFALARAHNVDTRILPGFGITTGPPLHGTASGVVAAAGTPGRVLAQGRLQMGRGQALGMRFDRLATIFGYDDGAVEVDRLLAQAGKTSLHTYGRVSRDGTLAMRLTADDVSLRAVGQRFGLGRRLSGRADIIGTVQGTMSSPVLTAELSARSGVIGPFPFDVATGIVQVTPTRIATPGLRLRDGSGRYEVDGSIRWSGQGWFDLTVQAEDVPAPRLLKIADVPIDLAGTVRGRIHVTGPVQAPQAAGAIQLRHGQIEGQPVDRAEAEFRWTGTQLVLDRAAASVNSSTVEAKGTVSRAGALNIGFSGSAFRLRDIGALRNDILDVDGTVDLTGTLAGTLRVPTVSAAISSTSLALNGQRFDRAEGRVQYKAQRFTLNPLSLQRDSGTFLVTGTVQLTEAPRVDVRIRADGAELATLLNLTRIRPSFALRGVLKGELAVSGPLSSPRAIVNVTLRDGQIGDHPIRDALVEATLADEAVMLRRFILHPGQGELVGAGRIDLRRESDVEFAGTGLSLDLLRPLLRIRRPLTGTLDMTLQLSGRLADPVVGLSATVTDGAIGSAEFDRLVLQAFFRDGQFQISPAVLQEGSHRARLDGSVPFNPAQFRFDETRPMDLRLSLVNADLSVLGLVTDAVERAEGPLTGDVRLSGTVSRPRMEGTLSATEGSIKLRRIEPALTSVRGTLTFREDEMRLDQLTARMGEGTLTASGTVAIRNFRPDRLQLQLVADGAQLKYDPHFAGLIDGMLRIEGTAVRPLVAGALELSHGDLVVGAARRTTTGNGAGLNPVLDIDLRAGDELLVSIGDLRLRVHGTVHAGGTWREPRLAGEATATSGNFTAFNTTFRLTEGRATFAEFRGITPYVDATAQTRVTTTVVYQTGETSNETITVFVHIQGTPGNLTLDFTSDPPRSREEILTLLEGQARLVQALQCRPPGGDQLPPDCVAALEAALRAELSEALFGPIGREVARALGLEEFIIEYDFVRPLQLRIGKLLVSNLFVTLDVRRPDRPELGGTPRYVWSLEYRFSPSTRLAFSADNQGVYDLLYLVTYRF